MQPGDCIHADGLFTPSWFSDPCLVVENTFVIQSVGEALSSVTVQLYLLYVDFLKSSDNSSVYHMLPLIVR